MTMFRTFRPLVLPLALGVLPGPGSAQEPDPATPQTRPWGAFAFQDSVQVPLEPLAAFDAFVNVDAWWDHRFSENPVRFTIDPRPGGAFLEEFDDSGDGVLHATVILVKRGETLRMRGPLGLTGYALDLVFTLSFRPSDGGALVHLDLRGAGELEEAWPGVVASVWHHFLWERFKPFTEGRLGRPRPGSCPQS